MPSSARSDVVRAAGVGSKQNTIDLQWKNDAVCNVRLCKGKRNAAGARAMGSNEKAMRGAMENNTKNNGNRQKIRGSAYVRLYRRKAGSGAGAAGAS
jgi:hypothetical protein